MDVAESMIDPTVANEGKVSDTSKTDTSNVTVTENRWNKLNNPHTLDTNMLETPSNIPIAQETTKRQSATHPVDKATDMELTVNVLPQVTDVSTAVTTANDAEDLSKTDVLTVVTTANDAEDLTKHDNVDKQWENTVESPTPTVEITNKQCSWETLVNASVQIGEFSVGQGNGNVKDKASDGDKDIDVVNTIDLVNKTKLETCIIETSVVYVLPTLPPRSHSTLDGPHARRFYKHFVPRGDFQYSLQRTCPILEGELETELEEEQIVPVVICNPCNMQTYRIVLPSVKQYITSVNRIINLRCLRLDTYSIIYSFVEYLLTERINNNTPNPTKYICSSREEEAEEFSNDEEPSIIEPDTSQNNVTIGEVLIPCLEIQDRITRPCIHDLRQETLQIIEDIEDIESDMLNTMEEFNTLLSDLQEQTVVELDDIITNPKQTPKACLKTPDTVPLTNLSTVDNSITNKNSLTTDESIFHRRNLITRFNDSEDIANERDENDLNMESMIPTENKTQSKI